MEYNLDRKLVESGVPLLLVASIVPSSMARSP